VRIIRKLLEKCWRSIKNGETVLLGEVEKEIGAKMSSLGGLERIS